MAASSAERQSALQLGLSTAIIVIEGLHRGRMPKPRQILGLGIVFAALSLVEVAPDPWPNVASKFGWLFVLTLAITATGASINPADNTNMLSSVAMLSGGAQQPGTQPAPLFPS